MCGVSESICMNICYSCTQMGGLKKSARRGRAMPVCLFRAGVAGPPGVEAAGHGSSALERVILPLLCSLRWMISKCLPLTRGATMGM